MIKSIKLDNGKEYRLFTSRMAVEVKTSRIHAETGCPIWMRVNGPRVISQVITAIADADHTEALDMNAAIEWAKITPEQRAIHDARVTYGISLKNKYNIDDVLEACHAEALEMNRLFNMRAASGDRPQRLAKETGFPVLTCLKELIAEEGDYFTALERLRQIVSDAHTEALNMDAARELNARQARFVFHNTAAERADAIEEAHAQALKMDAKMDI